MFRGLLLTAASLVFGATQAYAICEVGYLVTDTATNITTATRYDFTVTSGCNLNNAFQSLLVPYFSDANISNVTVPSGWTYFVSATDVFGLGTETLEFTPTSPLSGLTYGTQITGISFTSSYGPVNGPIGETQSVYGTSIFDPPIPGSPDTIKALGGTSAPEPSTTALSIAAMLVILGAGVRFKRRSTA